MNKNVIFSLGQQFLLITSYFMHSFPRLLSGAWCTMFKSSVMCRRKIKFGFQGLEKLFCKIWMSIFIFFLYIHLNLENFKSDSYLFFSLIFFWLKIVMLMFNLYKDRQFWKLKWYKLKMERKAHELKINPTNLIRIKAKSHIQGLVINH